MRIDFDKIREDASGRWLSIFRSLGIEVDESGRHSRCPHCGGNDRFRVDKDVAEKGSYYCSACRPGDGFSLVMKVLGVDIKTAMESVAAIVGTCEKNTVPREDKITPEKMREIFNGSKPVQEGDPVWRYLRNRGLHKIPKCLRYHPKIWESETQKYQKAMLAVFMGSDNQAITMHRTYIDADGNKLKLKSAKKILPGLKKMNGGSCRLYPLDSRNILGVAEGIETAIAAHEKFNIPVWAATNAGMIEEFEPPKGINELHIFSDNDTNYTGQKASYLLGNKAILQKKIPVVRVFVPDMPGEDWLDVLVKEKQ